MQMSEKVVIVNSFIYANFNSSSSAWHFSTCESIRKIEKIKKSHLKIVDNGYDSDEGFSLTKSGKVND